MSEKREFDRHEHDYLIDMIHADILTRPVRMYMSAEEKSNAPHGITCSRGQAIELEISGVDCDCWKADL